MRILLALAEGHNVNFKRLGLSFFIALHCDKPYFITRVEQMTHALFVNVQYTLTLYLQKRCIVTAIFCILLQSNDCMPLRNP